MVKGHFLSAKRCLLWLLLTFAATVVLTGCGLLSAGEEAETIVGNLADGSIKILIAEDGMVRISQAELAEAGITVETLSPETISLSEGGNPVAFHVVDDGIVFFGKAPASRYTRVRPYLLHAGEAGLGMATSALGSPDSAVIPSINNQLHLEENLVYTSKSRASGSEAVWFWEVIQPGATMTISATLPAVSNQPALLRVRLWGASYNQEVELDHDLDVIVNDTPVGLIQWDGQTNHLGELVIPAGVLKTGVNNILIDNSREGAVFVDVSQLDWIELHYAAPSTPIDNYLDIAYTEGTVRLTGFRDEPLLYDVTDANNPILMTDWSFTGGQVDVPLKSDQHLIAVGSDGYRSPDSMSGYRDSNWSDTSTQADLIIVTTDGLAPALEPLVAAREAQGLSVALIPVAEIYDEFGHGEDSPESIQRFVAYAYENWTAPAPQYLFLVGEATYDYQGNVQDVPRNTVPSLMVPVAFSGETVSDTRFADVDNDLLPDMAVGRWPVANADEVESLVERTLAYETGSANGNVLFTADGTEAQFASISDRILDQTSINPDSVNKLYGASSSEVTDSWNEGAWLISYVGHGSLDKWGKDDVLSQEAVANLGSGQTPPIVLQFTCLSGFFAHPSIDSLSESMLRNKNGPVLLLGATSLTLSAHQEPFAVGLLNALEDKENLRIGDALQIAKRSLNVATNGIREVSDTFGLIGDPSAIIVRP